MSSIGKKKLMFRRTTNRYAKKGSISNNKGYLSIARDSPSGKFASRSSAGKPIFDWLTSK